MATERQRAWKNTGSLPQHMHPIVLTAQQRARIRERLADGDKPADLATEYGVSARTIRSCH
jgi:hypothetical protein